MLKLHKRSFVCVLFLVFLHMKLLHYECENVHFDKYIPITDFSLGLEVIYTI